MLSQTNTDLWAGIWEPLIALNPFGLRYLCCPLHYPPSTLPPLCSFPGSWSLCTSCWSSLALWFLIGFSPRKIETEVQRVKGEEGQAFYSTGPSTTTAWAQVGSGCISLPKVSVYSMAHSQALFLDPVIMLSYYLSPYLFRSR